LAEIESVGTLKTGFSPTFVRRKGEESQDTRELGGYRKKELIYTRSSTSRRRAVSFQRIVFQPSEKGREGQITKVSYRDSESTGKRGRRS